MRALHQRQDRRVQHEVGQVGEVQAVAAVSAVPAMTRFGTLAGRIAADRIGVATPTASTAPVRPGRPGLQPELVARAPASIGISSAMRPRLDGMTKASRKLSVTSPAMNDA